MNKADMISHIQNGVKRPWCKSYLIEAPPGTNHPDIITDIYAALSGTLTGEYLPVIVAVDHFDSEDELIDYLIKLWYKSLVRANKLISMSVDESSTKIEKLTDFAYTCRNFECRLVLIIRKFENLFKNMSSSLLAALRDLEQDNILSTINVSPLDYYELYSRRNREDKGFTSDYGQMHVRFTLQLLSRDEAFDEWVKAGFEKDSKLGIAHFDAAYNSSGGLPAAFYLACKLIKDPSNLDPDLRSYMQILNEQIPRAFERLLRYDEQATSMKLITSVSHVHLGTKIGYIDVLRNHKWSNTILSKEGNLTCNSIGVSALRLLRQYESPLSPELLYENRQYIACKELMERTTTHKLNDCLYLAASIMSEVFGDEPDNYYFRGSTRWKEVLASAQKCVQLCTSDSSKIEFSNWALIAGAMSKAPKPERSCLDSYFDKLSRSDGSLHDSVLCIGIRIFSIMKDCKFTTAGYLSIPLLEDILRHYVHGVLMIPPASDIKSLIEEKTIEKWWWGEGSFEFSKDTKKLAAAELALIAACISDQRGTAIYSSKTEAQQTISVLDNVRNLLGHYVTSPDEKTCSALSRQINLLYNTLCQHSNCSYSIEHIKTMLAPPKRFLSAGHRGNALAFMR